MLAPVLLFSDRPTLWSPSGRLIDQAFKAGESGISKGGFLELLRNGHVRIAAREFWLTDVKKRNASDWDLALWDDSFDPVVLRYFEEDQHKSKDDRRVIMALPESGDEQAHDEIGAQSEAFEKAIYYFSQGFAPKGTLERIKLGLAKPDLSDDKKRNISAWWMLRDAINHENARADIGADTAVEEDVNAALAFADIAGRPDTAQSTEKAVELDRFKEALLIVSQIAGKETAEGLMAVLENAEQKSLIADIMQSTKHFGKALADQMSRDLRTRPTLSGVILGSSSTEEWDNAIGAGIAVVSATSLLCAVWAKKTTRRNFLRTAVVTAAIAGFTKTNLVQEALEAKSFFPASEYAGQKWTFLLKDGLMNPTWEEVAAESDRWARL